MSSVRAAWAEELPSELDFWDRWLGSKGLSWPDDYHRRFDPAATFDAQVGALLSEVKSEMLEVIDIGAGPVTRLGYIHNNRRVNITAVDALADEYDLLLTKYAATPPVRTVRCNAEELAEMFDANRFHIATAFNSLDHSYDPISAIRAMLTVVRPGGYVYLQHARNEGENESYAGLHKWNFDCRDGSLMLWSQSAEHNLSEIFAPQADVDVDASGWGIIARVRKHSA